MPVTLPKEKTKPTIDLSSKTILLYGPPKIGKCLSGSTLLYDPRTGRPCMLEEIVKDKTCPVLSMAEGGVLKETMPSDYLQNCPDHLFRLTTQTGRVIETTAEHPFLTRDGWKTLQELQPNDRVAVVAGYRGLFGGTTTDHALIKILAYLLADGSLGGKSSPIFTKNDDVVREVRMEVEKCSARK